MRVRNDLHTLGRWTRDRATIDGAHVAVIDRGVRTSYRELDERASRLAAALVRAGYRPGDVIASLTGNSVDHIVVFFACAKAGLALAPLSWRLTAAELGAQLRLAAPQLLVAEHTASARAHDAIEVSGRSLPVCDLGEIGIEAAVPAPATPQHTSPRTPVDDDPVLLIFTSGTTARSKAVVLTHANCFWANESLGRVLSLSERDVVLAVMPQYHVGGWNVQPLLALRVGATLVLERTFEAGRALKLIGEHAVTAMMGVPQNYLFMAQHPDFLHTDLSSLRAAVVGGGPAPVPLLRLWHDRGVDLVQGYGLSEAGPNVLCLPIAEARAHVGSVGVPYPFVEVALRHDDGSVTRGEGVGELLVRGPAVMPGYLHDADATARAFVDGWLCTGDRATRDAQGRTWIIDRIKDIFISGGESVAPVEIETALMEHPDVADVAVAGVPDPTWGERAVAWIVPRTGAVLDESALAAHLRARLAAFKVPRAIVQVDRIPRSSSGKALRRVLVERALADTPAVARGRDEGIAP